YHVELGWNMRMSNIEAALGLSQLRRVEEMNERRRKLARIYLEELSALPQLRLPVEKSWAKHVYNLFTIRVEGEGVRDKLAEFLRRNNVETAIHYPTPLHRQPALANAKKARNCCEASEKASKHVLSLPLHPGLREEDVIHVSKLVKNFLRGGSSL
ncbi:MAG: DegT/DnrJ/EryC1/StrS family aminotransferase, partial [Sulfolobales archaeon]|nr:DegT/DnrJ/EryC1/StrS family aminotransferase [Sulfolobales archaeon]